MEQDPNQYNQNGEVHHHEDEKPKVSFWGKIGGGSLSVSIMIHALLFILAATVLYTLLPAEKPPKVDFMPEGGGGGQVGVKSNAQTQKRMMSVTNMPRVAALNATSSFTLPEPDPNATMSDLGALSSGGMAGGMGGSGSGGGKGDGKGSGFGSGSGPGMGGIAGAGMASPFGAADPNANALEGQFFDLKQSKDKKANDMTPDKAREVLTDFINRGWDKNALARKFYKADTKLYSPLVYIPLMEADGAPKAFNCEKDVQPSMWIAVYSGNVVAPKTGRFRFVGMGDDMLAVRFQGKNVFDFGYYSGTAGQALSETFKVLSEPETKENRDAHRAMWKNYRNYVVQNKLELYPYSGTPSWNGATGGLGAGQWFNVQAGSTYSIDIAISEVPGGKFAGILLIEEDKAEYAKDSTGSPILPVFRTDAIFPADDLPGEKPPYQKEGSLIWKRSGGQGKIAL